MSCLRLGCCDLSVPIRTPERVAGQGGGGVGGEPVEGDGVVMEGGGEVVEGGGMEPDERRPHCRRRLFEGEQPGEMDNLNNYLQEGLRHAMRRASERWNFDFENNRPLEGRWEWEPVEYGRKDAARPPPDEPPPGECDSEPPPVEQRPQPPAGDN